MDDKVDVGVIGLGKMGILHLGILNSIDGVKIKSIAENQKFLKNASESILPRIHFYDDYNKMLDQEDLDLVYITTPTALHAKMIKNCLDLDLDFFVEKPLATSSSEVDPLLDKFKNSRVISMVGYCKHFIDTFAKAKVVLDGGELGSPIYFNSYMYVTQLFSKGSGWRYKKETSGGGVLNIFATHLIDVLYWFFGEIIQVNANAKSFYSSEVEDYVHSYILFKNGLEGYVDASWSIRNYRLPEIKIEVQCENGMLSVTDDYVKYMLDNDNIIHTFFKQDLYKGVPIDLGGPEYTREDMYLIDCIQNKKPTEMDIFYGYKIQQVTDAIYKSLHEQDRVDVF